MRDGQQATKPAVASVRKHARSRVMGWRLGLGLVQGRTVCPEDKVRHRRSLLVALPSLSLDGRTDGRTLEACGGTTS